MSAQVSGGYRASGSTEQFLLAIRRQLGNTLDMAAKEIQLATVSLVAMMLMVVLAAAAVVICWSLLVVAAMAVLAAQGFSWIAVALGFAVVHALIATACWQLVLHLRRNLSLPALRAALSQQLKA
jgi:hypothetical protein